jgi:hypothetical protein
MRGRFSIRYGDNRCGPRYGYIKKRKSKNGSTVTASPTPPPFVDAAIRQEFAIASLYFVIQQCFANAPKQILHAMPTLRQSGGRHRRQP